MAGYPVWSSSIPGSELCAFYRDLLGLPAQGSPRVVFRITERRVRAMGVALVEGDGADNDNRRPKHPPYLRPC